MAGWYPLGSGEDIPSGLDPSLLEPPFDQSSFLSKSSTIKEPAMLEGYQSVPIKIGQKFFPNCPNEAKITEKRAA